MTCSEQINLLPEGGYQRRSALHASQIATGAMSYIAEIASAVVGRGVMFEVSPNALDRVHVGCVPGQVVDGDLPTLSLEVRLHELLERAAPEQYQSELPLGARGPRLRPACCELEDE